LKKPTTPTDDFSVVASDGVKPSLTDAAEYTRRIKEALEKINTKFPIGVGRRAEDVQSKVQGYT
jgi:hypothetical protein